MDAGLRKLWTRRKSRGQDGLHDSGVSSLRKSQSTDQTGLSFDTSPRSRYAYNSSTSNGTTQFSPASPSSGMPRPGSSNKVQPVLLGVSRPSSSRSRPGTAESGSLMNAVNRAADAVAKAEQDFQHSAERYNKAHMRPKPPRYIDIFSISKSNGPSAIPGYNEDVAERNLDLARVALEGTQYHYVPSSSRYQDSSKYQEEVANRNASDKISGNGSLTSSPLAPQTTFERGHALEPSWQISSPSGHSTQPPPRFDIRPLTRHNYMPSSTESHSRQQSGHSWGSQPVQAPSMVRPGSSPIVQRQTSLNYIPPSSAIHAPPEPHTSPAVPPRHPGRQWSDPRVPQVVAKESLHDYQLSASEAAHIKSTGVNQLYRSRTSSPTDGITAPRMADYPVRPPSNLSNASSVKRAINLPNRTIMDLTGNDSDVFSEDIGGSNRSASTTPEYTRGHMTQRPAGSVASGPERGGRTFELDAIKATKDSPVEMKQYDVVQAGPVPLHSGPVSGNPSARETTSSANFTSAFSPINTVASASPRTSVVASTLLGSADMAGPVPPQFVGEGKGSAAQTEPDYVTHPMSTSQQDDRGQTQTSKADAGQQQRPFIPDSKPTTWKAITNGVTTQVIGDTIGSTLGPQPSNGMPPAQPNASAELQRSNQPYKHMAGDTSQSGVAVSQGRGPVVITRDFASPPPKPALTSVPEDTEVGSNGQMKRPGMLMTGDLTNEKSYAHLQGRRPGGPGYTFDEAGFAQKQAEARAALVRLQQSLNESFLTQAPSESVVTSTKSNNTPKHASSISDGRPVAPMSIFAQARATSPPPTGPNAEAAPPAVERGPDTSFLVSSTSSSSISTAEPPEKGKHKGETGLNGPGPSIVNEVQDLGNPLPPPPPLHLNGLPLQRIEHPQQQQAVPPSPGEISLSSFPIPVSSPRQSMKPPPPPAPGQRSATATPTPGQRSATTTPTPGQRSATATPTPRHAPQHSYSSSNVSVGGGRILRRQSSQRSQASSTSQFSIPYHMIPDRSSSMRDHAVREEVEGQ